MFICYSDPNYKFKYKKIENKIEMKWKLESKINLNKFHLLWFWHLHFILWLIWPVFFILNSYSSTNLLFINKLIVILSSKALIAVSSCVFTFFNPIFIHTSIKDYSMYLTSFSSSILIAKLFILLSILYSFRKFS